MKNDIDKKKISKYLKKETSAAFTDNVMQGVYANVAEADLKSILKGSLIHKTPDNFTSSVINSIKQETAITDYKPIISKKVWYIIGVIFILILAFSYSQPESNTQSKYIITTLDFINSKINVFSHYLSSNTFLMMIIVSISSLVILEALLKSNKFEYSKI